MRIKPIDVEKPTERPHRERREEQKVKVKPPVGQTCGRGAHVLCTGIRAFQTLA
jgi:hypothetical protein